MVGTFAKYQLVGEQCNTGTSAPLADTTEPSVLPGAPMALTYVVEHMAGVRIVNPPRVAHSVGGVAVLLGVANPPQSFFVGQGQSGFPF